jgi:putative nucleotidyltransferase with HDIG domain
MTTKSKALLARSSRRREEIRRTLPRPSVDFKAILQRPEQIGAGVILFAFLLASSFLVVWSRDQVKIERGQIMTATKLTRLQYQVEDEEATHAAREEARKNSPRVYKLNETYLERLQAALLGLPKAVAGKTSLDEISTELRNEFDLNDADLRALQGVVENGAPSQQWTACVGTLIQDRLVRNPIIRSQEFQNYSTSPSNVLLGSSGIPVESPGSAIELRMDAAALPDQHLVELVKSAKFPPALVDVVVKRLSAEPQPTYLFSEAATSERAKARAEAVRPVMIKHEEGEILYKRGDVLTPEQYGEVVREAAQYVASTSPRISSERWQHRFGIVGLIAIVTLFLGSFATIAYPRIVRNPLRMAAICTLMGSMLAVSVLVSAYAPIFLLPAAIGPTLFVALILLVAYDQRLALLLSGLQCMLVAVALEQSISLFILLIAGCATMIAQLREVRHRNSLVRAATGTAVVLGAGTVLWALVEMPLVPGAWQQILIMAFSSALTSFGVGFLVLGILPSIERIFDITTGMTLAELRDPKRPLLRQLQQRAPGTYNHSLQVANIAEAAAEAIGADSLLVYVGALYHDIGKINKPEYFVENQAGGENKHDKLSPAMSLLVIVGHVKNGIELAREYGLPRSIIHFIESHHGTTLVEYFYHAAKAKSEATDAGPSVAEVEYRYPGPKPRTKEAAILMLADAVESAARSMAEPNPSRIETLVRKLSTKRLEDNQFDQCDLTFRELSLIEDSIINRLLAIYHGRISYPGMTPRAIEQSEASRAPQAKPASA